jgi:hypothetical protein
MLLLSRGQDRRPILIGSLLGPLLFPLVLSPPPLAAQDFCARITGIDEWKAGFTLTVSGQRMEGDAEFITSQSAQGEFSFRQTAPCVFEPVGDTVITARISDRIRSSSTDRTTVTTMMRDGIAPRSTPPSLGVVGNEIFFWVDSLITDVQFRTEETTDEGTRVTENTGTLALPSLVIGGVAPPEAGTDIVGQETLGSSELGWTVTWSIRPVAGSECYSRANLSCEIYSECFEASCPCEGTEDGYFLRYGKQYCERFLAETGWSRRGNRWRNSTLICLQEAIVPRLPIGSGPACNCTQMKELAFSSHVDCYTTPGASICQLGLADWRRISAIVDAWDLLDEYGRRQMAAVVGRCLAETPSNVSPEVRAIWILLRNQLQ